MAIWKVYDSSIVSNIANVDFSKNKISI